MGTGIVDRLKRQFPLKVTWVGYELHPETPSEGLPVSRLNPDLDVNDAYRRLQRIGGEYGLVFNPVDLIPNSRLALEATAYAAESGALETVHEAFFRAFFTEGRNISLPQTVLGVIAAVGLDTQRLETALQTGAYTPALQENAELARRLGVQVLPTYLFDDGSRIVGARPYRDFVHLLGDQAQ